MSNHVGFRFYRTIEYDTPNEIVELNHWGSFILAEVTAEGSDIIFYPNKQNPTQNGIPVKDGTTRQIPLRLYDFKASGNCTVVLYGA